MFGPIFFDRFAMAFSLAIHIILAVIGVVLPVLILCADYLGAKYEDKAYAVMARRLSTALLVFFAVGTASGFLVAANLFFLWPTFMTLVGKVAILPVYVEVFAFFMESIFLAIYFYSHSVFEHKYVPVLVMGVVALGAAASAALITVLNAFMNTPAGFNISAYLANGTVTGVNPLAVFFSPSAGIEVMHVVSTSYFAGAALFLAYFAYRFLNAGTDDEREYYRKALRLTFYIALIATVFAIMTGIWSIEGLYSFQPEKYAAIELDLNAMSHAPEIIGGIYVNGTVQYGLAIPDLQSILATGSANGTVPGLNQYPQSTWPPLIVHDMFDLMFFLGIGIGGFLFIIFVLDLLKKKVFTNGLVLKLFILLGAAGLVLLENGWMVDEFGRQPWIIYNVMTVQQAANMSPSIIPIAILIVVIYIIILPLTFIVLKRVLSRKLLRNELKE